MSVHIKERVSEHRRWGLECARGLADSSAAHDQSTRQVAIAFIRSNTVVAETVRRHTPRNIRFSLAASMVARDPELLEAGVRPGDRRFLDGIRLGRQAVTCAFDFVADNIPPVSLDEVPDLPPISLVVPQLANELQAQLSPEASAPAQPIDIAA